MQCRSLSTDEISEAISLISSESAVGELEYAFRLLFERWAALAPEKAFAVALELAEELRNEWSFGRWHVARGWGKVDPQRAIAAADELFVDSEIEGLRELFLVRVFEGWVTSDPVAAIAGVVALPSYDHGAAIDGFRGHLLKPSLHTKVAATLSAVSDEWLRADLSKTIGGSWARRDGVSAAAWFDTIKWETPHMAAIPASEISRQWISNTDDIGPALDWFDRYYPLATEEMKSAFSQKVTRKWETKKLPEAAAWLENQRTLHTLQRLGQF